MELLNIYSVKFVCLFLCLLRTTERVQCDCMVSVKDDFNKSAPLFLTNDKILEVDTSGSIYVAKGQTIVAACPGNSVVLSNTTLSLDSVDVFCKRNMLFATEQWEGQFKEISCKRSPKVAAEKLHVKCYDNSYVVRVGYKIRGKFYKIYEACFDDILLKTHYVVHNLSPATSVIQSRRGLVFYADHLFGKYRVDDVYKLQRETQRFARVLGRSSSEKYFSKEQFLNRGHLAPRADFPLRSVQRATFHYVNIAPQWKLSNAGDWNALESALRRRIQIYGNSVVVFTGTHGVLCLRDDQGQYRDMYLDADANNNNIVPIPLYFFKVVYDPEQKLAAVFVSINNPYLKPEELDSLIFCDDICTGNTKFKWLKWRQNDNTTSFCCTYEQFSNNVDVLPKLYVKGLFY